MGAARWATWDRHLADRYIKEYELDVNKSLGTLSRGQKSLVSIVMGLAAQCPITLLDEPYLGLDVQNRQLFYRHLLEDVERNPRTIILSTHHIEDAAKILEDVIFIDRGHITGVSELERVTERIAVLTGSEAAVATQLTAINAHDAVLSEATAGGQRRAFVDMQALACTNGCRANGKSAIWHRCAYDASRSGTSCYGLTGRELEVNGDDNGNA